MSASLHDLIGRIINPQSTERPAVAQRPTPADASLYELIGRTMGPPSARPMAGTSAIVLPHPIQIAAKHHAVSA